MTIPSSLPRAPAGRLLAARSPRCLVTGYREGGEVSAIVLRVILIAALVIAIVAVTWYSLRHDQGPPE
jgi:hypothetical protein